jgi:hypothetical protein
MANKKRLASSENKTVSINGDVKDSTVIIGDNNTVNKTTIIQKFFNIFKSDEETLEHRNRRILLNHVESAWIKGVLDASLHGAALLDLGIKPDPEAVTQYPWAIKKESTNETLPAGLSMLEIFDSIGMGRSLLILGAPGSGKTTMLLELARGLIARAREDVTQPIPMVFNLASWTEKLTLADWLAQELNNLYSVPRKTAPDWVKGNKLLLLLDGLDEVRQDSRAKCVEAINEFRKQNGLTSLAVCSRDQDYSALRKRLSFNGAIIIQPLTSKQVDTYLRNFRSSVYGLKGLFKKDKYLQELAETPLFLSIFILTYRKPVAENAFSIEQNTIEDRRKRLFDNYIDHMLERDSRGGGTRYSKSQIKKWLTWLAAKMAKNKLTIFHKSGIQDDWLKSQPRNNSCSSAIFYFLAAWLFGGLLGILIIALLRLQLDFYKDSGFFIWAFLFSILEIWASIKINGFSSYAYDFTLWLASGLIGALGLFVILWLFSVEISKVILITCFFIATFIVIIGPIFRLAQFYLDGCAGVTVSFLLMILIGAMLNKIGAVALIGMIFSFASFISMRSYFRILFLSAYGYFPLNFVPFLDHCVDLIFLRRVGGGYIFIHRLLMEHFAEMYVESPRSKGK